jgi:1-acyl-sn-glycerol-3-phosphate acyltransferase
MGTNRNTIEKFSIGHFLLRAYVDYFFKIFFRTKSYNYKNVPQNEIVIFAVNHQNTLMDALAILATVKKQPVFMARADIFNKKTISKLLTFFKILPIYRIRDGKENLRNNDAIFLKTVDVLKNKNGLVILPEGSHLGIRRLRTLKKGISRIALQAEESNDFKLNIKIVPVGQDYSNYINFGSRLFLYFGEPINVSDYYEAYKENPPRGMNLLRERVEEELKKYMIHIESDEYYDMIDFLRKFYLPEMKIKKGNQPDQLVAEQKIIEKLNQFIDKKPEEVKILNDKTNKLKSLLSNLNLRLWVVQKPTYSIFKIAIQSLIMLGLLPVFLYGALLNYIPFNLPVRLTKKIKDPQFLSSFRFVIGILLFPVYYLILAIIGGLIWGNTWLNVAFVISLPLVGLFAFYYFIEAKKLWAKIRYTVLIWRKNPEIQELRQLHEEISKIGKDIL